jgi:beta-galactosidase/beta-glucuronidase
VHEAIAVKGGKVAFPHLASTTDCVGKVLRSTGALTGDLDVSYDAVKDTVGLEVDSEGTDATLVRCDKKGSSLSPTTRDVISFDFGWKHRTGLTHTADPDAPVPSKPWPGVTPPESVETYDDSSWMSVQLPHDGLIGVAPSAKACPDGCSGKSYIPRHVLWYRKAFNVPASWENSAIWLDFAGSFRNTSVWVNGVLSAQHVCGYTPFRVRLDNITALKVGAANEVAVFVDPDNGDSGSNDHGSGWWYEGGGLYRHVNIVRAHPVHIEQDGLFAYSNVTFAIAPGEKERRDTRATRGVIHVSAAVYNSGKSTMTTSVEFQLTHPNGTVLGKSMRGAHGDSIDIEIPGGQTKKATSTITVQNPELWSSSAPSLYTVTAIVKIDGASVDRVSTSHGFRKLRYDANNGFFLNQEHFKVRGFCDHNNFAVVGMAVPERVNLFRAQASRAVGGNGRRTSHNPPDSSMLDIYDRIGIVVMDENRLFDNNSAYVTNMGALVKRDRNHPSVVIWSFCNEGGCEGSHENGGPRFQRITQEFDGTRPTLANMFTYNDLLSNTIDVQGFSHQSREKLDACHAKLPTKPIYMSECCSCNTMRDEDEGCETLHDNPHKACTQPSFNARCAESNDATNASDGVNYAVGTMVWTLFDYYGEPPVGGVGGQGEVSSTYGQYDLCGFPKAAAQWYRTQWLLNIDNSRTDKTFPTLKDEVFIVESWESPNAFPSTKGNKTRSIHAYSSTRHVELFANGVSQGVRDVRPMIEGPGSYAEWLSVPWGAGNLTAIAKNENNNLASTLAKAVVHTNGKASKLLLEVDAPHALTGTGSKLVLDGHDAALLRASVVDENNRVSHFATNNITFSVISGPAFVQGTGNGDPHAHEPNNAPWHSAYHGLVRGVIRVKSVAARDRSELDWMRAIDMDGPLKTTIDGVMLSTDDIVVEISSPGFQSVRITIPTSIDDDIDGVFASAEKYAGKEVVFERSQDPSGM